MKNAICPAPRCDKPSQDGYLCNDGKAGCTEKLRRDLEDITRDVVDELATSYLRQARFDTGGPSSRSAETALPYDSRAGGTTEADVTLVIVTWTRRVAEQRNLMPPASLAACGRLLLEQLAWIRRQPFAGELFDELHRAVGKVVHIIDRPASPTFLGLCPGGWPDEEACGESLWGHAKAHWHTCPTCDRNWPAEQLRNYFATVARDWLATAIECSRAIDKFGDNLTVTPDRIRKWKERGRLVVRGLDTKGHPLYRVGDVEDRLREDAIASARREAKRERTAS